MVTHNSKLVHVLWDLGPTGCRETHSQLTGGIAQLHSLELQTAAKKLVQSTAKGRAVDWLLQFFFYRKIRVSSKEKSKEHHSNLTPSFLLILFLPNRRTIISFLFSGASFGTTQTKPFLE